MNNPNKMTISTSQSQINGFQQVETELSVYAETQGKQTGQKNQPCSDQEYRVLAHNPIESKIQVAIEENHRRSLTLSGGANAQKARHDANAKMKQLQAIHNDAEHKFRQAQEQKKNCSPDTKKQLFRRIVNVVVALVATTEGYVTFEALLQASFPIFPAVITSITIALCIGFGVHAYANAIQNSKTKLRKSILYGILLIVSAVFFYTIGHLRADAYNSVIDLKITPNDLLTPPSNIVSEWKVTFFSNIIFWVSVFLSIYIHKSKAEREQELLFEAACKEADANKKQMIAVSKEIDEIDRDVTRKEEQARINFEAAVATENKLIAFAVQARNAFIDKNMCYRTDGLCPPCFSNPPVFRFTRFFQTHKN